MQIYKVGGAVRDRLLGQPVSETDWVVVGASAEELTAQGFRPVGADFPVFLHPKTGQEYAHARRGGGANTNRPSRRFGCSRCRRLSSGVDNTVVAIILSVSGRPSHGDGNRAKHRAEHAKSLKFSSH